MSQYQRLEVQMVVVLLIQIRHRDHLQQLQSLLQGLYYLPILTKLGLVFLVEVSLAVFQVQVHRHLCTRIQLFQLAQLTSVLRHCLPAHREVVLFQQELHHPLLYTHSTRHPPQAEFLGLRDQVYLVVSAPARLPVPLIQRVITPQLLLVQLVQDLYRHPLC